MTQIWSHKGHTWSESFERKQRWPVGGGWLNGTVAKILQKRRLNACLSDTGWDLTTKEWIKRLFQKLLLQWCCHQGRSAEFEHNCFIHFFTWPSSFAVPALAFWLLSSPPLVKVLLYLQPSVVEGCLFFFLLSFYTCVLLRSLRVRHSGNNNDLPNLSGVMSWECLNGGLTLLCPTPPAYHLFKTNKQTIKGKFQSNQRLFICLFASVFFFFNVTR